MKKTRQVKPFKYEMTKRKEKWKSKNEALEKLLLVPPEAQPSVIAELVTNRCYNEVAKMLDLPLVNWSEEPCPSSVDTVIPFIPPQEGSLLPEIRKSLHLESEESVHSTLTESTTSSQYESPLTSFTSKTDTELSTEKPATEQFSSDENETAMSDFVEVEKKIHYDQQLMLKRKAVLKFLSLSEEEAATWRVKERRDVTDMSDMTLEEQGDFLMDKTAMDFCDWMRKLGGDENSFISEDTLKELFQIGMDNPASRSLCMMMRERRVLYYKLAEFLRVPEKSFHEILSLHLKWDAEVEKKPSKLIAFGKGLPKDLRFKTPKNNTAETWLEWNKLSSDELNFADVYKNIKDLRSTKEYCKWMIDHPEHKKPKYLVEQGKFERKVSDGKPSILPIMHSSDERTNTVSTEADDLALSANIQELFQVKVDKSQLKLLVEQDTEGLDLRHISF